jgi:hypothetical protein
MYSDNVSETYFIEGKIKAVFGYSAGRITSKMSIPS